MPASAIAACANRSSRGANALAAPLLASLTDVAVLAHNTTSLLGVYRLILLAASVGTIIAALGIPSVCRILARGIAAYENREHEGILFVPQAGEMLYHLKKQPQWAGG